MEIFFTPSIIYTLHYVSVENLLKFHLIKILDLHWIPLFIAFSLLLFLYNLYAISHFLPLTIFLVHNIFLFRLFLFMLDSPQHRKPAVRYVPSEIINLFYVR